jgi:hypothetical protein
MSCAHGGRGAPDVNPDDICMPWVARRRAAEEDDLMVEFARLKAEESLGKCTNCNVPIKDFGSICLNKHLFCGNTGCSQVDLCPCCSENIIPFPSTYSGRPVFTSWPLLILTCVLDAWYLYPSKHDLLQRFVECSTQSCGCHGWMDAALIDSTLEMEEEFYNFSIALRSLDGKEAMWMAAAADTIFYVLRRERRTPMDYINLRVGLMAGLICRLRQNMHYFIKNNELPRDVASYSIYINLDMDDEFGSHFIPK